MRKIILIDALSYLRLKMENEDPKMFIRGVLNETKLSDLRIWVWDGPGGNDARRALFPAYKTRPYNPSVITAMNFVRELIDLTPAWQIRIPGFEGDDVIAHLVKHFLKTTDLPIQMLHRDGDLNALCALSDRVQTSYTPATPIPFHLIRLYKVCVGDGSDTIPGIKGFGKGSWEGADKAALALLIRDIERGVDPTSDDEARLLGMGVSKASTNWLMKRENCDQVRIMARIIDPLPIPEETINAHMKMGTDDPVALEAKLREFLI